MALQDFVLSGWWGSPNRNQMPEVGSTGQPASPKAGSPIHALLQARDWGTSELALGQVLTPAVTHSLGHSGNAGIHPLPPTWSLWTPGRNPDWEEKAEAKGGRKTFHTQGFPPPLENSTLQADRHIHTESILLLQPVATAPICPHRERSTTACDGGRTQRAGADPQVTGPSRPLLVGEGVGRGPSILPSTF